MLAHGFTRLRCADCTFERLVPFSRERRGFCPICGERRMAERAASLVDELLERVPVHQWVLTLPYRRRSRLEWGHALCRAVRGGYARVWLACHARTARSHGIQDGWTGTLTVIQRFASGLQLNVHRHTLVLDGVFSEPRSGQLTVHPALPPRDEDVAHLLATVRARVGRLLARRQLAVETCPFCQYGMPYHPARHHAPTYNLGTLADPEVQRLITRHADGLADLHVGSGAGVRIPGA